MHRGYVKLWRKSLDSGMLQNHKLWAFWSWCLLKASHKECVLIIGCQSVHLFPGQFVFGLNKASAELDMSIRSIRTILEFLKKAQNLTIKSTNKYSIITIINWDSYQSDEIENDIQIGKPPTSYRQATDNKQECKEYKNKKIPKGILSGSEPDDAQPTIPYGEIINYLNLKTHKQFKPNSTTTKQHIKARWNQGYRLDDFKRVVDLKASKWGVDPKMVDYLRPQTLFGTKFEAYLNECDPENAGEELAPWERELLAMEDLANGNA